MLLNKTKDKEKCNIVQVSEFESILNDIVKNPTVKQMNNFMHHCDTSCFDHCKNVAYYSYILCKKLNLNYTSAIHAGMLHDFFLYNWRKSQRTVELEGLHAFVHPKIALKNAEKLFDLTDMEKDIILKHMWPLTLSLPKYKESYIITLVDKFCTLKETFSYIQKKNFYSFLYKNSITILALFVLSI